MASLGAQNWGADEIDPELVMLFSEFAVSSPLKKQKPPINDPSSEKKIETPPKVLEEKNANILNSNFLKGLGKVRRNKNKSKNKKMKLSVPLEAIIESEEEVCL